MRRTDLSRPSFYVYFRDRHHLVLRVVEHLGSELYEMSDRWLRGTGEGHRPYTTPGSTMTNGSAAGATVTGVDGATITVKYKDGEKKIVVPPNVPIVRYEIGSASDLKVGAAFRVLAATKQPDGSYTAPRINVGRDGVTPPM